MRRSSLLLICATFLIACRDNATQPPGPPEGTLRVLFIGNSYTFTNDMPGMLTALAAEVGHPIQVAEVTFPDYALVDHWNEGVALAEIAKGGWSFVVLQQGRPSSTAINRDSLRLLTNWFAAEIAKAGARGDALHPTLEGTYLSALALFGALTSESPVGLPNSFMSRLGRVEIDEQRAIILQDAASAALASVQPD